MRQKQKIVHFLQILPAILVSGHTKKGLIKRVQEKAAIELAVKTAMVKVSIMSDSELSSMLTLMKRFVDALNDETISDEALYSVYKEVADSMDERKVIDSEARTIAQ